MATYTAPEAAKSLGVGVTTLKSWSERVGVGHKTGNGVWVYSDTDMKALELVRSLRDEDRSFDTIVRRIRPIDEQTPPTDGAGRQPSIPVEGNGHQPAASVDTAALVEQITAAVAATVRADTELAQQYAIAARQVGQLESQVANLQERLDEARRLLTDDHGETETLKTLLTEEKQARIQAEAALQALQGERARPWWRRIF